MSEDQDMENSEVEFTEPWGREIAIAPLTCTVPDRLLVCDLISQFHRQGLN